jgi:hypothetical protein
MTDENPPAQYVSDSLDPVSEPNSAIVDGANAVNGTAHRIGGAIDTGRKPGLALRYLSNMTREAPLGSLLGAFLLGVVFARRR